MIHLRYSVAVHCLYVGNSIAHHTVWYPYVSNAISKLQTFQQCRAWFKFPVYYCDVGPGETRSFSVHIKVTKYPYDMMIEMIMVTTRIERDECMWRTNIFYFQFIDLPVEFSD